MRWPALHVWILMILYCDELSVCVWYGGKSNKLCHWHGVSSSEERQAVNLECLGPLQITPSNVLLQECLKIIALSSFFWLHIRNKFLRYHWHFSSSCFFPFLFWICFPCVHLYPLYSFQFRFSPVFNCLCILYPPIDGAVKLLMKLKKKKFVCSIIQTTMLRATQGTRMMVWMLESFFWTLYAFFWVVLTARNLKAQCQNMECRYRALFYLRYVSLSSQTNIWWFIVLFEPRSTVQLHGLCK